MYPRRNVALRPAASSIPARGLVWVALPLPCGAATLDAQATSVAAMVMLPVVLAVCWHWKRRIDRTVRRSELRLDLAGRELLACREWSRQLSEQAQQARQAALDEQQRLEQALLASEQRLELHLECASELAFVLDLDGRFQQLSRNWSEVLGVEAEGLIGQHHAWRVHPDDLPACQVAIERALASRSLRADVEYRIRHAAGDWRWHAARIAPLSDARGSMVGLLGVARMLGACQHEALSKACFDALTGLPARGLCLDRLQQMLHQAGRHANRAALLLIRLDGFRALNERHGHATGDLVLLESAARISASVRGSDTVGRGSGATFVVLLPDVGSVREAFDLAHRIRQALREPLQLRSRTLDLTACIGVAVYPPHGADEEELAAQAQLALGLARQGGGDQVALPLAAAVPAGRSGDQPA